MRQSELYDALVTVAGASEKDPEESSTQLVTRHSFRESKSTAKARLLVAEDNSVKQKVALRMLERLSYRVDVTKDSLEALEVISPNPYSAILMDVQMRNMDGYETTPRFGVAKAKTALKSPTFTKLP